MAATNNSIAGDTSDSVGTDDKVSLVGGVV